MKKILLFIFILLSGGSVFSQIPGITYQAVIMNSDGQPLPGVNNSSVPLSDQEICLKFLFKDAFGKNEYEEIISTKTDSYGMVNVVIGTGERVGGSFPTYAQIVWDAEAKFLEVSLDKEGLCANFVQFSSQQFTAVPFSLFAANSGSSIEGPQGPVGLTGAQGEKGETGAKGDIGLTGDQGLKGDTGTQGIQGEVGPQGIKGDNGDTGVQGIQGIAGTKGDTGEQGIQGIKGDQGDTGAQGLKGDTGVQGIKGAKGDTGLRGDTGAQGIQGEVGLQGIQGLKGDTGAQGIKGDKGDTGVQGIQGEVGLQGIKGDKGDTGLKGDMGSQGIQGDKGDTGLNGDTGVQGVPGLNGLDGAVGATGPQGPQGVKGDTGLTGDLGPIGLTGAPGPTGPAGAQGPTGLTGPTGNGFTNGTAAGEMMYWNGTAWVVVATTANVGAALQMIGGVPTWVGGTPPTVPDAPTILTATAGDAQATVAFTAPTSDGGAAITTYTVTSSPGGITQTGTSSPITITGLTNGTPYTFTVTATNSVGTGAASAASNSVTPAAAATAPDAPTIGTATGGDAQATVAFTAPTSNGGATITGYTVTSSPGGITATGTSSPITITGLTNGTAYTFTVTATNSVGTGSASDHSNSVTPVAVVPPGSSVPSLTSTTSRVWMDRNLGASQVATSSTDVDSYGDLYQWGRGTDGHQIRTPFTTTATKSSSDTPSHGDFITSSGDWRSSQNVNLWQGVDGINNPCPSGYRLPTETEWTAEIASWGIGNNNAVGAFASPLKFPMAGRRNSSNGSLGNEGSYGGYWSSTVVGTSSQNLFFNSSTAGINTFIRANGLAVRCIQDGGSTSTSATVPDAPTIVTATAGDAQATVAFTVPTSDGGAAIITYTVTSIPDADETGGTATATSSPITITGLTNGTAYTFTVTATNSVGTGAASAASNSVTPAAAAPSVTTVTSTTTGKVWMDRNLGASQVATSSTDAAAYGDLYQWGRGTDGHQSRTSGTTIVLSSSTSPGTNFITESLQWYIGTNPDDLWQGVSGVNNPCPSGFRLPTGAEWEAEIGSWGTTNKNAAGAFASPLKLPLAGNRSKSGGSFSGVGTIGNYWSSSFQNINNSFILYFTSGAAVLDFNYRALGGSIRCFQDGGSTATSATVPDAPTIVTAIAGDAQATVAFTAPTSDGGAAITTYTVTSIPDADETGGTATGTNSPITITGLTNGTAYTFTVTATNSAGTGAASAASNSVTPVAAAPSVTTVTSTTTGKVWMDRNLGATQVATSSTDEASYGDLYQWGRGTDGHQIRTSGTTPTLSTTDTPGNGNFILAPNSPNDWRSSANDNLWQGVNGVNNPCPTGYRLPTETEWEAERVSWSTNDAAGALASPLKLPMTGRRHSTNGSLYNVGTYGYYWSSTVSSTNSRTLFFFSSTVSMNPFSRANGYSVRCIQDVGR